MGSDAAFSADMTLVESRVVLIRARSEKEAGRKAAAEAKRYASSTRHRNPYGQRVRLRYLGYLRIYDINEPATDGTEVYSETEVVSRTVSDRAVVKHMFGPGESKRVAASRRNVLDIIFIGPAPGVKLTAAETATVQKYGFLKRGTDA